ncbi:MAG: response regulator [Candidatus Rokubacteria bacterium]|nr:response regulator [Candidatus Rokubacteria bacterium]
MRLLLIEDDLAVAETLRDFLLEQGHEVLLATNGAEGLQAVIEGGPDAAFVDVVLPKLSGLALLERLKRLGRSLPVVAMSGHASEDEARACLRLGALDYLAKPFTLDQVGLVLEVLEVARFQGGRQSPSLSS